jgi:hypothetical protein
MVLHEAAAPIGPNLSPNFFVGPDLRSLLIEFPEIESMYHLEVNPIRNIVSNDDMKSAVESTGVSSHRKERRAAISRVPLTEECVIALGHNLIDIPGPESQAARANAITNLWLQSPNSIGLSSHGKMFISNMGRDIVESRMVDYMAGINNYSRNVQERVYGLVKDDDWAQYMFLKSIVRVETDESMQELEDKVYSPEMQALRWLNMFSHVKLDKNASPVTELLKGNLQAKTYERFIALGLLDQVGQMDIDEVPEALVPIRALLSLVEFVSHDGQVDHSRLAEAVAMWPKEQQAIVKRCRQDLLKDLNFIDQAVSQFTRGIIARPDHNYLEDFYQRLDELSARDRHLNTPKGRLFGAAAVQGQYRSKKIKGNGGPPQTQVTEASGQPEAMEKEPLALKFVNREGEIFGEDSPQFARMISDFLDQHKGMNGLPEDIERILDYLRKIDLSNGQQQGLKRTRKGNTLVQRNGHSVKESLWEFKPSVAPGLSLRTNLGSRTRTLVTLIDGSTVGILGITHRDKLDQFIKKTVQTR